MCGRWIRLNLMRQRKNQFMLSNFTGIQIHSMLAAALQNKKEKIILQPARESGFRSRFPG